MYLVLIAWMYVALMMAVAEATSPIGTVLGAIVTFVLYGALPMGVVVYIMGSPARKRAIKAKEMAEREARETNE
jgi:predicted membrane channel-forming protein YqfA (hemolysin III family)